jgi:hypothetical protein
MHSFYQFHYGHKTLRLQLQLKRQLNDWAGHDSEHWFDPEDNISLTVPYRVNKSLKKGNFGCSVVL